MSAFEVNFLGRTSKADLIKNLTAVHEQLSTMSQEPSERPVHLQSIVSQLASKRLLKHSDREIRLLTACCLVDILRIYAPEAPFNEQELAAVFDVMINQLTGLATYDTTSVLGSRMYYILTSLSVVKSCVVLVYLAQAGETELLTKLFDALITSIRPAHSEEVSAHMSSILQACIEECETIDPDILDIVLQPLLPAAKIENPTAYALCSSILRRTASIMQLPLSNHLNHYLLNSSVDADVDHDRQSDLLYEHIYTLIYELHRISPNLLAHVIPQICSQLTVDDESIRLKAVTLLGRLFSSPIGQYHIDYPKQFREFLGRCVDNSVTVRLEMVHMLGVIVQQKPSALSLVEESLKMRLRDQDPDVRMCSLQCLLDMLLPSARATNTNTTNGSSNSPVNSQDSHTADILASTSSSLLCNFSEATIQEIGERLKDKKVEIKKCAMLGIARLYYRYVAYSMHPLHSLLENKDTVKTLASATDAESFLSVCSSSSNMVDIWRRLNFVPGYILSCFSFPDLAFKHLVVQLLQEYIIPKSCSVLKDAVEKTVKKSKERIVTVDSVRLTAVLVCFLAITPAERGVLGTVLALKTKTRLELSGFLEKRKFLAHCTAEQKQGQSIGLGKKNSRGSTMQKDDGALVLENKVKLAQQDLTVSIQAMAQLFPALPSQAGHAMTDAKKPQKLFDKLLEYQDNHIFRLLDTGAVQCTGTVTDAIRHREDLAGRLDSKSAVGEYFGSLIYDFASSSLMTNLSMCRMLCTALSNGENFFLNNAIADLLLVLSKHSAQVFVDSSGELGAWFKHCTTQCQKYAATPSLKKATTALASWTMLTKKCLKVVLFVASKCQGFNGRWELFEILFTHSFDTNSMDLVELIGEYAILYIAQAIVCLIKGRNNLNDTAGKVEKLVHSSLITAKVLNIEKNAHLAQDLTILAHLMSVNWLVTSHVQSRLLAFIRDDVVALLNEEDLLTITSDAVSSKRKSTGAVYLHVDAVCATLRLWSTLLLHLEQAAADGNSPVPKHKKSLMKGLEEGDSDSNEDEDNSALLLQHIHTEDMVDFLNMIFDCIDQGGGMLLSVVNTEEEIKIKLRGTCAMCGFDLITLKNIGKGLTMQQWLLLGWSFLDDDPATRAALMQKFGAIIQLHKVHPRFLAYPCLLASDDSNDGTVSRGAEQVLQFCVRRLRSTHEALCGQAMLMSARASAGIDIASHDDAYERIQSLIQDNMPETILPYVISLLSHHPQFPESATMSEESDQRKVKAIIKSVKMTVGALLGSNSQQQVSNLSYLFKQVHMIMQYYHCRLDKTNLGLHFVAQLTVKMLKDHIRTVDNVQTFPGDVQLPMDLYELNANTEAGKRAHQEIVKALWESEAVVDKLLAATGAVSNVSGGVTRAKLGVPESKAASSKAKGQHTKTVKRVRHRDLSDADSDEESPTRTKKAKAAKKPAVVKPPPFQANRSRRSGGAVDYREKSDTDKETNAWEAQAAISGGERRQSTESSHAHAGKVTSLLSPVSSQQSASTSVAACSASGKASDEFDFEHSGSIPSNTQSSYSAPVTKKTQQDIRDTMDRMSLAKKRGATAAKGNKKGTATVSDAESDREDNSEEEEPIKTSRSEQPLVKVVKKADKVSKNRGKSDTKARTASAASTRHKRG